MGLRCLIVDDNASYLAAASNLLGREGLAVVGVASSGDEALQKVSELNPDVVLVDIDLGGESGFDLVRRLAGNGGPKQAAILISSYSERDFSDLIASSAALGFVSKAELSASAITKLLRP